MGLTLNQKRITQALQESGARFIVIGGQAVRAHGLDRQPADLDIWIDRSAANARLVKKAMKLAGVLGDSPPPTEANVILAFPSAGKDKEVDLFTSIEEEDFDAYFDRSERHKYGSLELATVSVADLIRLKEISSALTDEQGRKKDIADIEMLRKLL
ncbi:hypothetical protein ACIPRI_12600 [Variovorax sp. LARHSF232]